MSAPSTSCTRIGTQGIVPVYRGVVPVIVRHPREYVAPASCTIAIGADVVIRGAPPAVEQAIVRAHTFQNPEFARKQRMGLWTGSTDEWLRLYRRTLNSDLVIPRGGFPLAVKICRDAGMRFDVADHTIAPALDVALRCGTLYPYQADGLEQLLQRQTGLLEAPTGSGKTNILLSVIPQLQTPTLILTHTGELFKQMQARCREWLGVTPGVIGAGKWAPGPITVAMIQTLAKRGVTDIAQDFGCVLVDECHHAPARTWADLLNDLPARYKYGFTATAWRKDGLQCVMFRTIGNITAKIDPAAVVLAGKILEPHIDTVATPFFYPMEDATDWGRMITALVEDDDRNALIAREVQTRRTPQTRALLLSDRIDHVHRLARLLAGYNPVVLTGELSKSAREAAMTAVRAGASLTIATSSLLGEGVDVPGWDLLFLTTPMAGGPRTLQAVGRVSRAAPGKDRATVVDFIDPDVPALMSAHESRSRLYVQVGRGR